MGGLRIFEGQNKRKIIHEGREYCSDDEGDQYKKKITNYMREKKLQKTRKEECEEGTAQKD